MFRFFQTRKSKRTRINRRNARRRRLHGFEALEDRRVLAVFVVDNFVDEYDGDLSLGDLSLREAIVHSNANGEVDTIQLGAGFYPLSLAGAGDDVSATGDLDIFNDVAGHDVTIVGAGAGQTFIDATGLGDRVFHVLNGAGASIEGVTISGGNVTGSGLAGVGGGIFVDIGSSLTVSDSEVFLNHSSNGGGGIYNREGTLTVLDSSITLNTSDGTGGGLNNDRGTTVVERTTISQNMTAIHGGGISSQVPVGFSGSLTVSDSTLVLNSAAGFGGGIVVAEGAVEVSSSTLSGNTANFGGGIHTEGTLTARSSTLFENIAVTNGGGIYRDSGTATVGNSIVAGNFAGSSNPDVRGIFVSADFNLIGDGGTSNGFTATADKVGTAASPIDPMLGPLQANGGPTATHAVLPGSPALDAGFDLVGAGQDQRGLPRPSLTGAPFAPGGDGSDIGAFEFQQDPPTDPVAVLGDVLDVIDDLLATGAVTGGQASALTSKIDNALKSLHKENLNAAINQLGALKNQINALRNAGVLTQTEADLLLEDICLTIDLIEDL